MMPTTGTPPNGASRAPPVLQLTGVTNIKRNEHKTQEILRSRFGLTAAAVIAATPKELSPKGSFSPKIPGHQGPGTAA